MTLAEYLAQPKITAVSVAAALGLSHSTILRWAEKRIPADRVAAVSAVTGIPAAELRPDLAAAFQQRAKLDPTQPEAA